MKVKFDRETLFKTFLKLQIIVPRYNGFHSMPGLSFHNNDDHKMVFHTWRTQNAVERTYVTLLVDLIIIQIKVIFTFFHASSPFLFCNHVKRRLCWGFIDTIEFFSLKTFT